MQRLVVSSELRTATGIARPLWAGVQPDLASVLNVSNTTESVVVLASDEPVASA
jgi:hypothetical protein